MSSMNTIPAPRFEGHDHGTRGAIRNENKTFYAEQRRNTFNRIDEATVAEEIIEGIRDYHETPTTQAQIDVMGDIAEYYKDLDNEVDLSDHGDLFDDLDQQQEAYELNRIYDNSPQYAAEEDEAYAINDKFDEKAKLDKREVSSSRHRRRVRLGRHALNR